MMLVFEGKANVVAKRKIKNEKLVEDCLEGETPLHEAKTGKILRILLSKTTPQQLMAIDKFEEKPLFDQILKHHPSTLKSYLDLMVTAKRDLESEDPHLIFDLSMFDFGTTKKANKMDKHLKLMEEDHEELLTHPVMQLFMSLKWHPNVVPYFFNFLVFLAFLFAFTAHGILMVDRIQCDRYPVGSKGK